MAYHRVLNVDEVVASAGLEQATSAPVPSVARPVHDWEAANQRKKKAVQQLAPLADALDDLEICIAELLSGPETLELG